jgi:hypothetical protein
MRFHPSKLNEILINFEVVCLGFFMSYISTAELQQALNNIFSSLLFFIFYVTDMFRDSNKKTNFFYELGCRRHKKEED